MLTAYETPAFLRRAKSQSTDIADSLWQQLVGSVPFREWKFCHDRRWRFDFAFIESKIAVEIEGGTWIAGRHVRPMGYARDAEKYNRANEMGWCVLRYTPKAIDWDQIRRALATRRTQCATA